MRQPKTWETTASHVTNQEWDIRPPELDSSLEVDLRPYVSETDFAYVIVRQFLFDHFHWEK